MAIVRDPDSLVMRRPVALSLVAGLALAAALASVSAAEARVRGRGQAVAAPKRFPVVSQPVVQPLPPREDETLDTALARLARNPRDADALVSAGNAALAMGDIDAAAGFFRRAGEVAPQSPRVKAGLARAMVRSENPFEAIPLFDAAALAGAPESALAADRGLAYDLVGDSATAQRHYRMALAMGNDDEVTRRLALSFAMAGDRRSAEATLSPLLQRQDKAAWRTRAFALAILGEVNEAVAVAEATLPRSLSASVAPYLRYMPRLTRAQQAAAANLGHFPRASEIGHDDPRIAQYAPAGTRRPAEQASADAALVPRGEPFGRRRDTRQADREAARAQARQAEVAARQERSRRNAELARSEPLAPEPTRDTVPVPNSAPDPVVATPVAAVVAPPSTAAQAPLMPSQPGMTATPAVATTLAAGPASAPMAPAAAPPPAAGPPHPAQATAFDLASLPARPEPPASMPAAAAPAPAPPPPPVSVADAFGDFARPQIDVAPAPGAVDVRRIAAAHAEPPSTTGAKAAGTLATGTLATGKAPAKPAAKPAPPSHPSRIWVQVATGRDKRALAFDWRRMTRASATLFRGKDAFISAWGQTNRLLTGPFPTTAAANAYLGQLRRADVSGAFLWNSPAGQVVDALPER